MELKEVSLLAIKFITFLACLMNGLLLLAVARGKRDFFVGGGKSLNFFTVWLIAAAFLWHLSMFINEIYVSFHDSNGFHRDTLTCDFFGISVILGGGFSITGHLFLAIDRYYIIVKGQDISRNVSWFLGISWSIYILTGTFYNYTVSNFAFRPMALDTWCFLPLYEEDLPSKSTFLVPANMLVIFLALNVIFISIIYLAIIHYVFQERKNIIKGDVTGKLKSDPGSTATSPLSNTNKVSKSSLEIKTLKWCILVTVVFAISYTPIFLLAVYALITKKPYVPEFDIFASILGILDGIWSPIVLLRMNATLLKVFLKFILTRGWTIGNK